jgi:hypothetical protein
MFFSSDSAEIMASAKSVADIDPSALAGDLSNNRLARGGMVTNSNGLGAVQVPIADAGLGSIRPAAALAANLNFPPPSIAGLQLPASVQVIRRLEYFCANIYFVLSEITQGHLNLAIYMLLTSMSYGLNALVNRRVT